MGRVWIFPSNVEKPLDKRTSAAKNQPEEKSFRFPLYYFNNYSSHEIESSFSMEEKKLYEAELLFLNGDYENAFLLLRQLKDSAKESAVLAGTLFFYCRSCIYLRKHREYVECYQQLKRFLHQDIPYQKELTLLLHELDTYTSGSAFYTEKFSVNQDYRYHKSTRNYLYLISAFSVLVGHLDGASTIDSSLYELVCCTLEEEGSNYSAMYMHLYLAMMETANDNKTNCLAHIRKGLQMAIRYNYLREVAFHYHYFPVYIDEVLSQPDMAPAQNLPVLCDEFYGCLMEQLNYMAISSTVVELDNIDFMYVYLAEKGYTNKEVADKLHLSVSTVSKHYSMLYAMTGAKNKKALVEMNLASLKNYSQMDTLK